MFHCHLHDLYLCKSPIFYHHNLHLSFAFVPHSCLTITICIQVLHLSLCICFFVSQHHVCLFACYFYISTFHNTNAFISLHLSFPYMYLSQHHHHKIYNNDSTIVNPTPYNKKGCGRGQGGIKYLTRQLKPTRDGCNEKFKTQ